MDHKVYKVTIDIVQKYALTIAAETAEAAEKAAKELIATVPYALNFIEHNGDLIDTKLYAVGTAEAKDIAPPPADKVAVPLSPSCSEVAAQQIAEVCARNSNEDEVIESDGDGEVYADAEKELVRD